jgi:hypothetical protein
MFEHKDDVSQTHREIGKWEEKGVCVEGQIREEMRVFTGTSVFPRLNQSDYRRILMNMSRQCVFHSFLSSLRYLISLTDRHRAIYGSLSQDTSTKVCRGVFK